MGQRLITDSVGLFSCEVEVCGPVLEEAIEHKNADDVLKCALTMALSVLAQDDPWPEMVMEVMLMFMADMREQLFREELC